MASSPSELANTLASLGPAGLKPYIVANNRFLWPFWCELIPDYLFCWQELTEVPIQSDGTFNAEICFWCPEDFPDLYFEVVQNLDGVETEIYDPQIACSTFYDYDGTESVDIVIDDPVPSPVSRRKIRDRTIFMSGRRRSAMSIWVTSTDSKRGAVRHSAR